MLCVYINILGNIISIANIFVIITTGLSLLSLSLGKYSTTKMNQVLNIQAEELYNYRCYIYAGCMIQNYDHSENNEKLYIIWKLY